MTPAVLIALIAYVLVPGLGAVLVRRQWRVFRTTLSRSVLWPQVSYRLIRSLTVGTGVPARVHGTIDSLAAGDRLWIRSGDTLVSVDMSGTDIYLLESTEDGTSLIAGARRAPTDPPRILPWSRLGTVLEGTPVFAAGILTLDGTDAVISGADKGQPLCVIYDGDDRSLLRRGVWNGRQHNEYWNGLTPGSLAVGAAALLTLVLTGLGRSGDPVPTLVTVALALGPVLPLAPPGLAAFLMYEGLWRRGRRLRAERDLIRLPAVLYGSGQVCADSFCSEYQPDSARPALRPPVLQLRRTRRGRRLLAQPRYRWFGTPSDQETMQEAWIVPGDPAELSAACTAGARVRELLAAAALIAGLAVNFYLVLLVLGLLV